MIWLAVLALSSGEAAEAPPLAERLQASAPTKQPSVYEAEFAPLGRSERSFASLGPVGPYYPERAERENKNGEAVLSCRAGETGALKGCEVVSDKPAGYAFGFAARMMANGGRIKAAGSPAVGEIIYLHVPFRMAAPFTEWRK